MWSYWDPCAKDFGISNYIRHTITGGPPTGVSFVLGLCFSLIGANVAYEGGDTAVSGILAFIAVVLAMINVVGGFAVTNRMLIMIAGKKRGGA